MASKKISEGVGKKIVEALKKQSEIEITPIPVQEEQDETAVFDELNESFESDYQSAQEVFSEELDSQDDDEIVFSESVDSPLSINEQFVSEPSMMSQPFINYQQVQSKNQDSFIKELDSFEIPSNVAVLKKLITQLPSGVSRHTGAQIIKQTMEALGISMKSVLQEAQQVQEGLNASANECLANVQEYKKQIQSMEKQAQNYHRQYTALNELISLFVQTGL